MTLWSENNTAYSFIYLHSTDRLASPPLHGMGPFPNQVPKKIKVPQEVTSACSDAHLCLPRCLWSIKSLQGHKMTQVCLSGCHSFWHVGSNIIWSHLGRDLEQTPLAIAEPIFTPPFCRPLWDKIPVPSFEALADTLEASPSVSRMYFSCNPQHSTFVKSLYCMRSRSCLTCVCNWQKHPKGI